MATFLDFLSETIYSKNGKVVITTQARMEREAASSPDAINTFIRNVPLITQAESTGGTLVYSLYNYIAGPEATNLLKSLKGSGPYEVDQTQLANFMARSAEAAARIMAKGGFQLVVYPKSSSPFLRQFIAELKKFAPKAQFLDELIVKREIANIEREVDQFINSDQTGYDSLDDRTKAEIRQGIIRSFKRNSANGSRRCRPRT